MVRPADLPPLSESPLAKLAGAAHCAATAARLSSWEPSFPVGSYLDGGALRRRRVYVESGAFSLSQSAAAFAAVEYLRISGLAADGSLWPLRACRGGCRYCESYYVRWCDSRRALEWAGVPVERSPG